MINKFKEWSRNHKYEQATENAFLDFNFQAWQAGYEYAKEEQDSNLTCDHCCDEIGMNDGSVRLCRECNTGTIYNHFKPKLKSEIDNEQTDAEIDLNRQFKETFYAGYDLAMSEKWINVDDSLPDDNNKYLVTISVDERIVDIKTTYFQTSANEFLVKDCEKVTHWQPQPQPPEV